MYSAEWGGGASSMLPGLKQLSMCDSTEQSWEGWRLSCEYTARVERVKFVCVCVCVCNFTQRSWEV